MLTRKLFTLGALSLAALWPLALPANADDRDSDRYVQSQTWVAGHYETRESRRVIPAEVRQEWQAPRYDEVFIPAVTERYRVAPVTERVRCEPAREKYWVPEVTERVWMHGYWDLRGWRPAQWENRVVTPGHFETQLVERPGCFETRVVESERWETRVVRPERRESRLVEAGRWRTVVVRPERYDVQREKVWVPGHWTR